MYIRIADYVLMELEKRQILLVETDGILKTINRISLNEMEETLFLFVMRLG